MPTKLLQGIALLLQQLEIFGNWIITAKSFLLGLSFCLMLQARTLSKGSSGFALEGFGGLKAMLLHLNHSPWMELYPPCSVLSLILLFLYNLDVVEQIRIAANSWIG